MPIYEYACDACDHQFEKLVKLSDAPPPCPECGDGGVRKLISAAAFSLKGGGWYKDHYGLKSGGSASGGGSAGAGTSGGE
jgi:putative FmdB family regulatory protein